MFQRYETVQDYRLAKAREFQNRRIGEERRRLVAEGIRSIMARPERRSGDERRED